MALDGARSRGSPHKPDQPENNAAGRRTPGRAAPAGAASTSEVLEEFAAVLTKMAEAEGRPGGWQHPEDPPCGTETPARATQATEPSDDAQADQGVPGDGVAVPGGGEAAGPIGTYRYGVTDLDGRSATYTIVSAPAGGRVIDNGDGTFDFDPGGDFEDLPAGETRDVSFTYQAADGAGAAATARVTVTVTGTNEGLAAAGDCNVEVETPGDIAGRIEGRIETIHIDGVSGAPGTGGWTVALNKGEIIETNLDNLVLTADAVGVIILGSDTGEIFFEGINRIEW